MARSQHFLAEPGVHAHDGAQGALRDLHGVDLVVRDQGFLRRDPACHVRARARRPEAMVRLMGIDALNRASMMTPRPLRDLRAAALGGLYALAPVRRTMMRAGLGLR